MLQEPPCEQKPFVIGCDWLALNRWSFDPDTKQCEQFIWGGCITNDNVFETKEACERTCGASDPAACCPPTEPVCCGGVCSAKGHPCDVINQDCSSYCDPTPPPFDKCCPVWAPQCCGGRCVDFVHPDDCDPGDCSDYCIDSVRSRFPLCKVFRGLCSASAIQLQKRRPVLAQCVLLPLHMQIALLSVVQLEISDRFIFD